MCNKMQSLHMINNNLLTERLKCPPSNSTKKEESVTYLNERIYIINVIY